jgi:predicted ATPase with chaperone activity
MAKRAMTIAAAGSHNLTVADLNAVDLIDTPHVEEAVQFVIGGVLRDFF